MVDSTPPEEPRPVPPGREQEADLLASFFSADGEEPSFDPARQAAFIDEARKHPVQRQREINSVIKDEDHKLVRTGREIGHQLAEFSPPAVVEKVAEFLDGKIATDLEEAGITIEKLVEQIRQRIKYLETDDKEGIFRALKEDKVTVEEGLRRQAGQSELTKLKIVLLAISEKYFKDGDIAKGLETVLYVNYDWRLMEPTWYTAAVAQALESANIEDEKTRLLVVDILNRGQLGIYPDFINEVVATTSIDQRSPLQRIARRVNQARQLQDQIEAAKEADRAKAEYENRMQLAWEEKIAAAIADGRDMLKDHFIGYMQSVHFRSFGSGSALLTRLSQDQNLWNELTKNRQERGAMGYLNVLDRLLHQPEVLDKAVELLYKEPYCDLAGKYRQEYEREGNLADWKRHIREQIQAEALGNTLGFLMATLEYDEQIMSEEIRNQLLKRSLEILGDSQAQRKFLLGQGESSPVEQLVRAAFSREIEDLQQQAESEEAYKAQAARKILRRAERLRELAMEADVAVVRRKENARKQAAERARRQEEMRQETVERLQHAQGLLEKLAEIKEKMLDLQAQAAAIPQLGRRQVDEIIQISQKEGKQPSIDISLNPEVLQQTEQRIEELRKQLTEKDIDPDQRRALRNELANKETEQQYLRQIKALTEQINSPAYKATNVRRGRFGVGKKVVPALSDKAFESLPQPKYEDLRRVPEVGAAEAALDKVLKPKNQTEPTQDQIIRQVQQLLETKDVLDHQGKVAQLEETLQRRAEAARRLQTEISGIVRRGISYHVRNLVCNNLRSYLTSERLIKYT